MPIDFTPTDEQALVVETVRQFAENEIRPRARAADEARKPADEAIQAAHALGLVANGLPAEHGGGGERSAVLGVLVAEELAWGDLASALAILSPALVAFPVADQGSPAQQKGRAVGKFAGRRRKKSQSVPARGNPRHRCRRSIQCARRLAGVRPDRRARKLFDAVQQSGRPEQKGLDGVGVPFRDPEELAERKRTRQRQEGGAVFRVPPPLHDSLVKELLPWNGGEESGSMAAALQGCVRCVSLCGEFARNLVETRLEAPELQLEPFDPVMIEEGCDTRRVEFVRPPRTRRRRRGLRRFEQQLFGLRLEHRVEERVEDQQGDGAAGGRLGRPGARVRFQLNMEDDPIIRGIVVVLVRFPSALVEVDFHIAGVGDLPDADRGPTEVGAGIDVCLPTGLP